jgi:hypothetical protein
MQPTSGKNQGEGAAAPGAQTGGSPVREEICQAYPKTGGKRITTIAAHAAKTGR